MMDILEIARSNGWVFAVFLFVLRELFSIIKGDRKKQRDLLEEMRISLAELRIHIKYLTQDRERARKMEIDIDRAFQEIRTLKTREN